MLHDLISLLFCGAYAGLISETACFLEESECSAYLIFWNALDKGFAIFFTWLAFRTWYMKGVLMFTFLLYNMIRVPPISYGEPVYLAIVRFLIYMFVFLYILRQQELTEFLLYKNAEQSQLQLDSWQCIVNALPQTITVLDGRSNVLAANTASEAAFEKCGNTRIRQFYESLTISKITKHGSRGTDSVILDEASNTLWTYIQQLIELGLDPHDPISTVQAKGEDGITEFKINIISTKFMHKASLAVIIEDLTERNKLAKLQTINEYKTELLANVSHDFRAPLNGCLNLLEAGSDDDQVGDRVRNDYLSPCYKSLKSLLYLVNDMVDMSQINANKLRIVLQEVDLRQVVMEAIDILKMSFEKKRVSLFTDIDPNLPQIVVTDPNRYSQILFNLLSNALKFTQKGYITVSVAWKKDQGLISTSVKDTGIGIKPEDKRKLFKAFGKLDLGDENVMNARGCGLGLMISNSLAKLLAKDTSKNIKVDSEYGKGSDFSFFIKDLKPNSQADGQTFLECRLDSADFTQEVEEFGSSDEIMLPTKKKKLLKQESGSPLSAIVHGSRQQLSNRKKKFALSGAKGMDSSDTKATASGLFKTMTILIVDDDPFNHLSLEALLKGQKLDFIHAYNGVEALNVFKLSAEGEGEFCEDKNLGLILMDCNMPLLDGEQTTKILHKKANEGFYVPKIIGLTGYSESSKHDALIKAGMQGVLTKPVSRIQLVGLLKRPASPKLLRNPSAIEFLV